MRIANSMLSNVLDRLSNVTEKRDGSFLATCPAHRDEHPSLDVSNGEDGRVLIICRAGCTVENVVAAMGLQMSDLFLKDDYPSRNRNNGNGKSHKAKVYATREMAIVAIQSWPGLTDAKLVGDWPYHKSDGSESFSVLRFDKPDGSKEFRPLTPVTDGWIVKKPAGLLPIYNIHEVLWSNIEYIHEGEKCCDRGKAIGLPCTTSSFGSQSAKFTDWSVLRGKKIRICPDHDSPGEQYAQDVARILHGFDCEVRIVRLPGLPDKGDLVDFIDQHDSMDSDDLKRKIEALAAESEIYQPPSNESGPDANPSHEPDWYTLDDIYDSEDFQNGLIPISSEYALIDDALNGGFEPGSVYVLAARTGDGKTTFALNILRRQALQGTKCLLVKIEETPRDAYLCIISVASGVPKSELSRGIRNLSANKKTKVHQAHKLLHDIPLKVSTRRHLHEVTKVCRDFVKTGGEFVCIDQLNLIQDVTATGQYQKVTNVSNTLRQLAVDLKLPILALCQINRAGAKAKSTDPLTLHDLRDSGHLENDAAGVIFINSTDKRPDKTPDGQRNKMFITTGKNRNGPAITVGNPITMDWYPETRRIEPGWVGAI